MADVIVTKATLKEVLAELKATGNALDGAKVMLWGNDIVPDENTVYADLTPAVFSGYALSSVVVWDGPVLDFDDNEWHLRADAKEFTSTTASPYVSGSAYGYAVIMPGTPNVLLAVCRFDTPYTFDQPDRSLTVVADLPGSALIVA